MGLFSTKAGIWICLLVHGSYIPERAFQFNLFVTRARIWKISSESGKFLLNNLSILVGLGFSGFGGPRPLSGFGGPRPPTSDLFRSRPIFRSDLANFQVGFGWVVGLDEQPSSC